MDTAAPESEDSCGLAASLSGSLLIRRSLVRAQVGEPKKARIIKALQRCEAFFFAGSILDVSNIRLIA